VGRAIPFGLASTRLANGASVDILSGFRRPFGLEFSNDGGLLVADMDLHRVIRFDDRLQFRDAIGGARDGWQPDVSGTNGSLRGPHAVCRDAADRLYVTEYQGQRIGVFDAEGRCLHRIGEGDGGVALAGPASASFTPEGALLVAEYALNAILRFEPTGRCSGALGAPADGAPPHGFGAPVSPTPGTTGSNALHLTATIGRGLAPLRRGPPEPGPATDPPPRVEPQAASTRPLRSTSFRAEVCS